MHPAHVTPPDGPPAPAISNLRDLGGHPVPGGRVRAGVVYRSAAVGDGDAAVELLERLGIRVVFDLRTAEEREARPDRLPAGVELVVADVLEAAAVEGSPAELRAVIDDPTLATGLLGDGRAERVFTAKYREFVSLDTARDAYGRLFRAIAVDPDRPLLFHCGTGKDRTGWAAAALLLLLGVPDEAVMGDYLRSEAEIRPTLEPFIAQFRSFGGDPGLFEPIIGTRVAYLDAALNEMRARFGSIEGYFADGLGIDAAGQGRLREALVEPG